MPEVRGNTGGTEGVLKNLIIPFVITIFVIAADQFSKYIVKTNMRLGDSFNLIPNILNIRYIENAGASFGILKDHRWVFMSLSSAALVLMLGAMIYLGRRAVRKNNLLINIALAFMFGGGAGNMIDRFFNVSARDPEIKVVVDFLELTFFPFIFNLADAFICVGSVLFCICIFAGKYKLRQAPAGFADIPFQNGTEADYE
jgi:signal peptidase II